MKEYFGNHLGICINNTDPENRGRVQVFIPNIMPALYSGWNELGEDVKLECIGNNLPNGLRQDVVEKLKKVLPWAEAAMPIIGNSVAGSYNPETGNFNQTNTPEAIAGSTVPGSNVPVNGSTFDLNSLPPNLQPYGETFLKAGQEYGVDPGLLAAISMHETANGKSSAFKNKKNAMGISNKKGPISFNSVEDSIFQQARSLARPTGPYAGKKTISEIGAVYAPIGAGNDPNSLNQYWTSGVTKNYQKLTKNQQISINDPNSAPDASAIQPPTNPFYTSGEPWQVQDSPSQQEVLTQPKAKPPAGGGAAVASRTPPSPNSRGISFATGQLNLTLPDGTQKTYPFNNGGNGTGAIPSGSYTISNPRVRNTAGMVVDGVGYSFDMNDVYDPAAGRTRTALRIHPDGGALGTMGCLGILGDANTQKAFYADMKQLVDANGGKFTISIEDSLPGSGQAGASSGGTPTPADVQTSFVKNPTDTQPSTVNTTGMAQGTFGIPGPGAMLWVFFREGNPLFPVYFAASYGAAEWASAQSASSQPPYGPQNNSSAKISSQTVIRPNNAGFVSFTGAVDSEKDSRAVRLAHANGGYLELHPYGIVNYSPNEHLLHIGGTSYHYCLNREMWTQGDDNKVTVGNQWIIVGNPSQANIQRIEKLAEKVKEINAEMLKEEGEESSENGKQDPKTGTKTEKPPSSDKDISQQRGEFAANKSNQELAQNYERKASQLEKDLPDVAKDLRNKAAERRAAIVQPWPRPDPPQ